VSSISPANPSRTDSASPLIDSIRPALPRQIQFWSACPSPLTDDYRLDLGSIAKMIEWHIAHRVDGIMVLGTCGEGPWLTDDHRRLIIQEAARVSKGRIAIAAQVSDNSAARVLEQIDQAARNGATFAVVAQPYFALKAKAPDLPRFYREIADRSALPLGFYDRGQSAVVPVPASALSEIVLHPRVKFVKDSSGDQARAEIYIAARNRRPDLSLMTGSEFRVVEYLNRGYDGLMLGGAVISTRYVRAIVAAFVKDGPAAARIPDEAMQQMLRIVYGGPAIACWLAGLKYTLIRLGVFSSTANHLGYTLTDECREAIDSLIASREALFAAYNASSARTGQ
jgi:4-hydroxy-tetrahydrodipicolinate synthase